MKSETAVAATKNGYSELFNTPRLARKMDSIRLAVDSVSSLKAEVRKVGAVTGSSQLHRQPCLVSICSFNELHPVVKCMTPKPGKTIKAEFLDFLSYAGKKLGIKASKAYLLTKMLQENPGPLEEHLRRLRRDKGKLEVYQLFGLAPLVSGDIVLIEDAESQSVSLEKPFDLNEIRSTIPFIGEQFIRTLVDEDEEKKDLLLSMTELPKVNGFKMIDRLGKGGIRGYSFLAQDERGFEVVLKEYKPDRNMSSKELSACLSTQMHCMLDHVNIEPIREFFVTDSSDHSSLSCWSVQEWFTLRSVLDELERHCHLRSLESKQQHTSQLALQVENSTGPGFEKNKVLDYMVQAMRGLHFLHDELKMVHGSIKLSNFLLDQRGTAVVLKIAHLSCGEFFQPTQKGATRFRSPESLESGIVSKLDDMFAIACCVAAMLTGIVDRERGIKGHFGNNTMLIQETIRDVSRRGGEALGTLVKNLFGKDQHRMSAQNTLAFFESALAAEIAGKTSDAPMKIIKAHQMSAKGPGAYAGVQDLLAAVRRAPPEMAEEYLKRLCGLCSDASECANLIKSAGHVHLVEQLRIGSGRAVEYAAMLIGQLCTGDAEVKSAFHAQKTIDALLQALETHKSKPFVIETISNTITLLCANSLPNCEDLEVGDGIAKLHKVACDGTAWTGTPRAKKKCSIALRVVSMSGLRQHDPISSELQPSGARNKDELLPGKTLQSSRLRWKSAVRALNCTFKFARENMKEDEKWQLERMVLDAFQSAPQLNKLFQDGLEPSLLNTFFTNLFQQMEQRELSPEDRLPFEEVCCVVKEGQESSVLLISKANLQNVLDEFPLITKTLNKLMNSVEVGDRSLQLKILNERKLAQQVRVHALLQLQTRTQVSSEEFEAANKVLEEMEVEALNLKLAATRKLGTQNNHLHKRLLTRDKLAAAFVTEHRELFVPTAMRCQLFDIVQTIGDPFPKCLDAIRLLRDSCYQDGPARQKAGSAGAIQALLQHCKGSFCTNVSKALAMEALSLLCSGQNTNKKVLASSQGVQTLVSMLECNTPSAHAAATPLQASNADIFNVVEVLRGNQSKQSWITDKQVKLLEHFPQSTESQRLSSALRKALDQCSCYVLKGATAEEACESLAKSIFQSVLESILLQENAAHALWIICNGESDQEAYIRFVLGKAGGIGALVELMEHSTDRAQEFSAAALFCACEGNVLNRLIFQECHGIVALCGLLKTGTPNTKEHCVATLRVVCDATRRVNKGSTQSPEGPRSFRRMNSDQTDEAPKDEAQERENSTSFADTSNVEGICTEAINLGVMEWLVELLGNGTPKAKTECAWAIRNMCLANSMTKDIAGRKGAVQALVCLFGSEFGDQQEHSVAAVHALCQKHEANSRTLRDSKGIPALIKVLTHSTVQAKENACSALLEALEGYPRCAFELGQKGKDSLMRLVTEGRVHVKLCSLANKVLQALRMILSAPALYSQDLA